MAQMSALDQILNILIPFGLFCFMGWIFWKAAKNIGLDKGIAKLIAMFKKKEKEVPEGMEEAPPKNYIEFE